MSVYGLVDMFGKISLFVGLILAVCAFMMPKGWRSPLGLTLLTVGVAVLVASLTHATDGRTWMQVFLARSLKAF